MLPSPMHICTWMFGQGQLLLLMRYQFKKNLLHFNDGLEVKQLQPMTAKCHKLPLFCFDDFSPSSKSMEVYKKKPEGSEEDRNMKRLALIQVISYLFLLQSCIDSCLSNT